MFINCLAHPHLVKNWGHQKRAGERNLGLKVAAGMEDGSGSSHALPGGKESELQKLQRQHEEKMARIQELKREIEAAKLRLEQRKSEVPNEKVEAFKALSDRYERLREEYNAALIAEKQSREKLH